MMLDKGLIKYYIINSISEESKPSAGASKIWRKAPIFCNKNKNHNNNINNNNSYNKTTSKYLGCDIIGISLVFNIIRKLISVFLFCAPFMG